MYNQINISSGHSVNCQGAVDIISEVTEDRKVKDSICKYLRQLGHNVLDVTSPVNYTSSSSADFAYGVNKANMQIWQ